MLVTSENWVTRYLDDDLCATYRAANLRFPQAEVGIVPICTAFILSKGPAYLQDSLQLGFSSYQVERIQAGMNRAHSVRQVPALTPTPGTRFADADLLGGVTLVDEMRIRAIWSNIVLYIIDALVDCVLTAAPTTPLPAGESSLAYDELKVALPQRLTSDHALFTLVAALFAKVSSLLMSSEGRRLARVYRESFEFADVRAGRRALNEAREMLHACLAVLFLKGLPDELSIFRPLMVNQRWRIFRPMVAV
jgi:hypothetical protein